MITEEQLQRQLADEFNPMAAFVGMNLTVTQERHRMNDMVYSHNEDIECLKKQIDDKNREIVELRKAVETLEEQNKELNVALKLRNEEIKNLKLRLNRLENDKKELEDELRSVQVKVSRMEKDIKELSDAKMSQEEKNMELQEHVDIVNGKMESRNQALKKEIKDIKESQHKVEMPLPVSVARGGRQINHPMLLPPHLQLADRELQASLSLGELCRQVQNKMYKAVLPTLFSPKRNYKIKNIRRDLEKYPLSIAEKQKCNTKWQELTTQFTWDEAYEEAMKGLQESRNVDAHPSPLTEEGLNRAAEMMNAKGNLKGWSSLKRVRELISIWKQLQHMEHMDSV